MAEIIHRLAGVKSRTGLARSTIYDLIKKGRFPPPIHLGQRSVGWIESELSAWIEERIALRMGHHKEVHHA